MLFQMVPKTYILVQVALKIVIFFNYKSRPLVAQNFVFRLPEKASRIRGRFRSEASACNLIKVDVLMRCEAINQDFTKEERALNLKLNLFASHPKRSVL